MEYELLRQAPIVIAACKLHAEVVELLLDHGATLPSKAGRATDCYQPPLLAFWISYLQQVADPPGAAALPMLQLLLRAGADPLHAFKMSSFEKVRSRVGRLCSFALSCTSPPLLAAAVRHGLACERRLAPEEVATLLVAARLAGLEAEAEALRACAAHLGRCFPLSPLPVAGTGDDPLAGEGPGCSSGDSRGREPLPPPQQQSPDKRRRLAGGGDAGAGLHDSPHDGMVSVRLETRLDAGARSNGVGNGEAATGSAARVLTLRWQPAQEPAGPCTPAAARDARPSTSCRAAADAAAPSACLPGQRRSSPLPVHVSALAAPLCIHVVLGGGGGGSKQERELQQLLRAQLVADAAAHGLHDVLELLLSQGASAGEAVPMVGPLPPSPPAPRPNVTDGHGNETRSPLVLAAVADHPRCVATLLRHGATVDAAALRFAVWALSARAFEALLAAGRARLPPSQPCYGGSGLLHCPILLLLERHRQLHAAGALRHAAAAAADRPHPLTCRAVRIMDGLIDAGYRIRVYRDACEQGADGVWRMVRVQGPEAVDQERLGVRGPNRLLWEACCRKPWSKQAHSSFHPAFKAATRTLLMIAKHGEKKYLDAVRKGHAAGPCSVPGPGNAAAQQELLPTGAAGRGGVPLGRQPCIPPHRMGEGHLAAALLGLLPVELLHTIIEGAAQPLSAWMETPQDACSGRAGGARGSDDLAVACGCCSLS